MVVRGAARRQPSGTHEHFSLTTPVRCLRPYDPDRGCLVTNLSRMPIQRLDFGAGSPGLVMPITIGRNSVAMLADREDFLLRFAD